jgi:outer membrane protein insertion porin family
MRHFIALPITGLALLVASWPGAAQKFLPKSIQFKGAPEYSDQELMDAAGLKKGMVLNYAEMNEHSKQLMDTGVLASLAFKFDGQDLIFLLTPSTELYSVRLVNLPLTQGKDLGARLHERFPLYHGKVPAEGGMLDSVRGALEEMLAAEGIKATVAVLPFTDQKLHKVTAMSFVITAPQVQVGEIRPDGASAALDPQARGILDKLSGSSYDAEGSPSQIETNLGNYYRDKGYLEADVHAAAQTSAVVTPEAIRVPFQVSISPGAIYKIAGVQLAPELLVTQADFDKQSHIHAGDIATSKYVRENWQFIERQYHNKGYLKAIVHPTPSFDRARQTASFAVTVEPGPVYTMGKLKIDNVSNELRARMLATWKIPAGSVLNEGAIGAFFGIGDADPVLERVYSSVNCKYSITLNDEDNTADVVLRLEKRH